MNRKSRSGPHFEDFHVGMHIVHPTPRTLTEGDRSLYIGLTGSRDPLVSATTTSALAGVPGAPLDPLLVFNVAFGKTVPDISLNAVANLGYADLRFLQFVFPGDTLRVESGIIGLREASNRKAGIVYTRSVAINQRSEPVLSWIRWVLVKKRVVEAPAPATDIPALPQKVLVEDLVVPPYASAVSRLHTVTGSTDYWEDYVPDERIDHPSAMTINDSDHSIATRLYQNTAKVHFDQLAQGLNVSRFVEHVCRQNERKSLTGNLEKCLVWLTPVYLARHRRPPGVASRVQGAQRERFVRIVCGEQRHAALQCRDGLAAITRLDEPAALADQRHAATGGAENLVFHLQLAFVTQ